MKKPKHYYELIPIYAVVFLLVLFAALIGNRAVQVTAEAELVSAKRVIVIDAGHGGEDGGAISCTGALESNINLAIAQRLNDLMRFLGFHTKMTRTEDISIYTEGESLSQKKVSDLKERIRICNQINDAILLSIHQNNFADGKYSGAQVFYSTTDGSEQLAREIQDRFVSTINPGSNRSIKKAQGIYLLENIQCPGVLIECGFLSSPEEEARLRSDAYQKKVCCVIATGCARFALDAQTND